MQNSPKFRGIYIYENQLVEIDEVYLVIDCLFLPRYYFSEAFDSIKKALYE